jgi:hypothetical protein
MKLRFQIPGVTFNQKGLALDARLLSLGSFPRLRRIYGSSYLPQDFCNAFKIFEVFSFTELVVAIVAENVRANRAPGLASQRIG